MDQSPSTPRDAITPYLPAPLAGKSSAVETGVQAGLPAATETAVRADHPPSSRSGRETAISFMLVALLGGICLFFLNFVSFGVFFYVMAAVVGITAVGFLHYVLWGYDLSEQVAEEMHAERLKRQQELDEHF